MSEMLLMTRKGKEAYTYIVDPTLRPFPLTDGILTAPPALWMARQEV